ncbi:MAG: membrane protein of unknown function [Candidatus Thorarchaeota archaeon]|nr:MAG: membrane protein of unknown function [Candidatus Thorarchaeota archaeon]
MNISIGSTKLTDLLRVIPIFGLLLYYIGGLIVSLDVSNNIVFVLQVVLFSLLLVVGLFIYHRIAVMIGSVLAIIGTAGPIAQLLLTLLDGWVGASALGGILVLIADILFVITLFAWAKQNDLEA